MAKKKNYEREAKKAVRAAKKYPKVAIAVIAVFLAILVALIVLWFVRPDIYHNYLGVGDHKFTAWQVTKVATCGDGERRRECEYCGKEETEVIKGSGKHTFSEETGICSVCGAGNADVSIHFLELGNKYTGDCTLIKCGDTEVLIDAGSRKDSAATIKEYVDQYCTDGVLEYVIATHAHQDHIAGFVGKSEYPVRDGILYKYQVETLIQFAGHNATTEIYDDYCKAVEYAKGKGTKVYTAKQCWYETDGAKKQYFLDDNENVSLNILYQQYYDVATSDENDYSVCTLLTQKTYGKTYNYLFTGDLEEKGEASLVESNDLPQVDLFKGGHHGSYTASTEKLLSVIKPKNVAVCCCCGTDEYTKEENSLHNFPAQEFIDRVSKYTENVYCTSLITYTDGKDGKRESEVSSMNGNITFYTEKGELKLSCSNNTTKLKDTEWFLANRVWKKPEE